MLLIQPLIELFCLPSVNVVVPLSRYANACDVTMHSAYGESPLAFLDIHNKHLQTFSPLRPYSLQYEY